MTYETITVEQLPNRAPNAYGGEYGAQFGPDTPDTFFSVQTSKDGTSWWNGYETVDEQVALHKLAYWQSQGAAAVREGYPAGVYRIVLIVKPTYQPVAVEEAAPVAEIVQDVPQQQGEVKMVPTQDLLQSAIKASVYSHDGQKYVSVQNVFQHLPKFEAPRRYHNTVESEIMAVFPKATSIGGGVFEL